MLKESEGELDAQDAADGLIDGGHGDATGLDEGGQFGVVGVRAHIDLGLRR